MAESSREVPLTGEYLYHSTRPGLSPKSAPQVSNSSKLERKIYFKERQGVNLVLKTPMQNSSVEFLLNRTLKNKVGSFGVLKSD